MLNRLPWTQVRVVPLKNNRTVLLPLPHIHRRDQAKVKVSMMARESSYGKYQEECWEGKRDRRTQTELE